MNDRATRPKALAARSNNPPARGKPRASGLSRDRIVEETLRHLRQNPDLPFSLNRSGAAVGATPNAIYRHFRDGADLADALLQRILDGAGVVAAPDTGWRAQVRAWMIAIYGRLVETRQSVAILAYAGGNSLAWARAASGLRAALAEGGLPDPQRSEAVFWITLTLSGFTQQTLSAPLDDQVAGSISALSMIEEETGADLSVTKAQVPRMFGHALDIMIERVLASIEMMFVEAEKAGRDPASH